MQTPLRITFSHMDPSPAVEARVREHIDRLERFHDCIISCHVMIEAPRGDHHQGAPFAAAIELTIPGKEFATQAARAPNEAHADLYVAIRDAFDQAKRFLHQHALATDQAAHSPGKLALESPAPNTAGQRTV